MYRSVKKFKINIILEFLIKNTRNNSKKILSRTDIFSKVVVVNTLYILIKFSNEKPLKKMNIANPKQNPMKSDLVASFLHNMKEVAIKIGKIDKNIDNIIEYLLFY